MKLDRSEQFANLWKAMAQDQPEPEREYRFHADRKWRFDFAWPSLAVAVEIDGVNHFGKSRHGTVIGMTNDCEKFNTATLLGWRLLRFTQVDLEKNPVYVVETVEELLGQQGANL